MKILSSFMSRGMMILCTNAFLFQAFLLVVLLSVDPAGGAAVSSASSSRSCCNDVLSPLVVDDNNFPCVDEDYSCHSHTTAPCLEDMFVYPNNDNPPTNGFFSGNIELNGPNGGNYQSFVDAQAFVAYNPFNPDAVSCIPSYNKIVGSCQGYIYTISKVLNCGYEYGEAPWKADCTYTIETAKGNLMLKGYIPSLDHCFYYLLELGSALGIGNQPVIDYIRGSTATTTTTRYDTNSLVGKCCADVGIAGGTDSYCLAEGSVRVCQLFPPSFLNEVTINEKKSQYCAGVFGLDYGVSLNFDGLKGCEKNTCCDSPKPICE